MQIPVAEPWSPSGAFWVMHQYLGLLPLVPLIVVLLRWRALRARFAFYVVGLVALAGISFLLHALVAAAEALVHGAILSHPPSAVWQSLRFTVPSYGASFVGLLFLWWLGQRWAQLLAVWGGGNRG